MRMLHPEIIQSVNEITVQIHNISKYRYNRKIYEMRCKWCTGLWGAVTLPVRTSLVLILVRGVYIIVACTLICFEWRFYCAGS